MTTWGKFELPDSSSSIRGSHLYRLSGFFQKSLTRMMTIPMYNLSTNSIRDMVKHIYTATLSRGTINGAFTSSHTNPICPAMSSLGPWNVSGMSVFPEISAIFLQKQGIISDLSAFLPQLPTMWSNSTPDLSLSLSLSLSFLSKMKRQLWKRSNSLLLQILFFSPN